MDISFLKILSTKFLHISLEYLKNVVIFTDNLKINFSENVNFKIPLLDCINLIKADYGVKHKNNRQMNIILSNFYEEIIYIN